MNVLDLRSLQKQVKKAFCFLKVAMTFYWPFTVWINCSNDQKKFWKFSDFSLKCQKFFSITRTKEGTEESPCQYLLLSTKQEFYIIGRLQQIQNFSKIPLLEMLYAVMDAEQDKKKPLFFSLASMLFLGQTKLLYFCK